MLVILLLFIMWLREARAINLIAAALPRQPAQETAAGAGQSAAVIAGDRIWYIKNDDPCFLVEPAEQQVETIHFYRKEEMVSEIIITNAIV